MQRERDFWGVARVSTERTDCPRGRPLPCPLALFPEFSVFLSCFLPPCWCCHRASAFAFGHKKKKQQPTAASASPLTPDQRVLHALNRLTFGPRPGDVAAVEAMGLDKWIDEQLNPETIDDSALEARLADYPAMRLSQHDLVERFPSNAMIRQAEQGKRGIAVEPGRARDLCGSDCGDAGATAEAGEQAAARAQATGSQWQRTASIVPAGSMAPQGGEMQAQPAAAASKASSADEFDDGAGRRYGSAASSGHDADDGSREAGAAADRGAGKEAVCRSGRDQCRDPAAGSAREEAD